jgi:hypothetical protein
MDAAVAPAQELRHVHRFLTFYKEDTLNRIPVITWWLNSQMKRQKEEDTATIMRKKEDHYNLDF